MDEYRNEERHEQQGEEFEPSIAMRWLVILSVVLFAAAVFAVGYAVQQNGALNSLKQQNQTMNSAELQMRSQMEALSAKVTDLGASLAAATATPENGSAAAGKNMARRQAFTANSGPDRRIKQMQGQLAAQQKELKQTQADLTSARDDLEGKLGSTRDELNGSIAKTHEELVSLAKRGERLFFEFDLTKSKSFHREGPIEVSLRKADAKHQSYDLMMLVDDHELGKKKVDLYEPIWLHQGDMPAPVQVVVNKIEKDHIHGYVSSPKYKESELSASSASSPVSNPMVKPGSSSTSPANNSSTPTSPSATISQGQQTPVE